MGRKEFELIQWCKVKTYLTYKYSPLYRWKLTRHQEINSTYSLANTNNNTNHILFHLVFDLCFDSKTLLGKTPPTDLHTLNVLTKLTKSKKSANGYPSKVHNDMRIFTIISLLCYTRNPSIKFNMQTIIGLFCHAYDLHDKGFEILNAFGCNCSVDNTQQHGEFCSSQRFVMDKLNINYGGPVSLILTT